MRLAEGGRGLNPKPEGRSPKETRKPKAEPTQPLAAIGADSPGVPLATRLSRPREPDSRAGNWVLRVSEFDLLLEFGLRVSGFPSTALAHGKLRSPCLPSCQPASGGLSFPMRITGGNAARRILKVPKGLALRPTPDLVKQAVFNSLGGRVAGARVLELFAGTGALSLECLSRRGGPGGVRGEIIAPCGGAAAESRSGRVPARDLAGAGAGCVCRYRPIGGGGRAV